MAKYKKNQMMIYVARLNMDRKYLVENEMLQCRKIKIMCPFTRNMVFLSWKMEQPFKFATKVIGNNEVET